MGVISEEEVLKFIANQLKIAYVDLSHYEIDKNLTHLLPEIYARRYRALIIGEEDGL